MIQPHPISTLFPYTTLFRSEIGAYLNLKTPEIAAHLAQNGFEFILVNRGSRQYATLFRRHLPPYLQDSFLRSEEHTSELQSQSNIVCRLLLEKKKQKCINS